MKIGKVRLGFATNSSSSHSIIIIKDRTTVAERYCCDDKEFHWEPFVLSEKSSKRDYFGAQLKETLKLDVGEDIANLIVKDFMLSLEDSNLSNYDIDDSDMGSVDHQSVIMMPVERDSLNPNKEFCRDFIKFLDREDVVVLGGNDNGDDILGDFANYKISPLSESMKDLYCGKIWAKKQRDGWWSLFCPKEGNKIDVNFDESAPQLKKARSPDLIDFKITNYCEEECPFCYQGSGRNGKHADLDYILNLLSEFEKMEVFELAIGGGEPTSHPHFIDILSLCRSHGIIPNFSTRNVKCLADPKMVLAINNWVGRVGVSCYDSDEVERLIYLVEKSGLDEKKFTVHYVLGLNTMNELGKIFETILETQLGLLLLGYKTTGRGKDFKPYNNDGWVNLAKSLYLKLGIDTCVANKYKEQLKKLKVSKNSYYTKEGKFSAYVDAVNHKIARSSYEPNESDYTEIEYRDMFVPLHPSNYMKSNIRETFDLY